MSLWTRISQWSCHLEHYLTSFQASASTAHVFIMDLLDITSWYTHLSAYDCSFTTIFPPLISRWMQPYRKSLSKSKSQTMHKAQTIDHDSLRFIFVHNLLKFNMLPVCCPLCPESFLFILVHITNHYTSSSGVGFKCQLSSTLHIEHTWRLLKLTEQHCRHTL